MQRGEKTSELLGQALHATGVRNSSSRLSVGFVRGCSKPPLTAPAAPPSPARVSSRPARRQPVRTGREDGGSHAHGRALSRRLGLPEAAGNDRRRMHAAWWCPSPSTAALSCARSAPARSCSVRLMV